MNKNGDLPNKYLLFFLPAGLLVAYFSARYPNFIENSYAQGVYKLIGQPLSTITGYFPLSLGELMIIVFLLWIIWLFGQEIRKWRREEIRLIDSLHRLFLGGLILVSLLYGAFIFSWGLNYYRLPFAEIADFDVRPASVRELTDACQGMIQQANDLRGKVTEDQNQVMKINEGQSAVFAQAAAGYKNAAAEYPALGGSFGPPKGVFFSKAMSYAGITGIYFPFTGEANVNTMIPQSTLAFTACHEMAHQRGFAREDEANFIAYLTCQANPDNDFQYSGTLMALIYLMNTLQEYDPAACRQLQKMYGDGVTRDLAAISDFWQRFEGPVERVSNHVNDLFLKSNHQADGVYSYNRMVDLLIAAYRENS